MTSPRRKLPKERPSIVHPFVINGIDGTIIVGLYADGSPGEVFIDIAKAGTVISGFADGIALLTSIALQHGVPLDTLVEKFAHTRFEPMGQSGNADIGYATSILDYVFRWLGLRFGAPPKSNRPPRDGDQSTTKPIDEFGGIAQEHTTGVTYTASAPANGTAVLGAI